MALEVATLGGGCFWCIEHAFALLKGVTSVYSGYAGGQFDNPTYEDICTGLSGHAEVIQITFNNDEIAYNELLAVFFSLHNPTTLNRQGNDSGTQYRSVIFYHNDTQKQLAESMIKQLDDSELWEDKVVTELTSLPKFYRAENYHQAYFTNNPQNPYCQMVVAPKVSKFITQYQQKLKTDV